MVAQALAASLRATLPGATCEIAIEYESALQRIPRERPEIVLLDLEIGRREGLELFQTLKPIMPATRWIVLTAHAKPVLLKKVADAGVDGIVMKGSSMDILVAAIETVRGGDRYFCPIASALIEDEGASASKLLQRLTPSERALLDLIADGLSSKDAAAILGLSSKTVDNRVTSIRTKLGIGSRTDIALFAIRLGLRRGP